MSLSGKRGITKRRPFLLLIMLGVLVVCAAYPGMKTRMIGAPLSGLPTPQSPLQQDLAAQTPPTPTRLPIPEPLSPVENPPVEMPTPTFTPSIFVDPYVSGPQATWTPKPTPVVFDEAEELQKEAIFTFFVERADGRQEIYYVAIDEVPLDGDTSMAAYEAYRQRLLQLGPGDRLVYECAPTTLSTVPEQFQCLGRKRVTLNTPP